MHAVRPFRFARRLAAFAPVLLGGCYTYAYAPEHPAPGTSLSLELSDVGRAELADNVGPEIAQVEGELVTQSDSGMTLRVSKTTDMRGYTTKWAGEPVAFRTGTFRFARERRFSAPRTVALVGSFTAGFVAFVATRGLLGLGGGGSEGPSGGGGGNTN